MDASWKQTSELAAWHKTHSLNLRHGHPPSACLLALPPVLATPSLTTALTCELLRVENKGLHLVPCLCTTHPASRPSPARSVFPTSCTHFLLSFSDPINLCVTLFSKVSPKNLPSVMVSGRMCFLRKALPCLTKLVPLCLPRYFMPVMATTQPVGSNLCYPTVNWKHRKNKLDNSIFYSLVKHQ